MSLAKSAQRAVFSDSAGPCESSADLQETCRRLAGTSRIREDSPLGRFGRRHGPGRTVTRIKGTLEKVW
eukprot:159205-Prorocentrum_minimum.AAC.1